MLYRPEREQMWDTWLVAHEGVFYLFYIRISDSRSKAAPRPSLGEGWNGISVARSTDLLHWEELGPVLEMHPEAAWLGTGMIHQVGGDFIMNFSEERPVGYQVISFARSTDLLHWERLPESFDLRPDTRFYQREQSESVDPLPRWDSLGIVPKQPDDPDFLAFVCANARGTLPGECGTLGFLTSADGLHWEQQPPVVEPGLYSSYEVPEYIRFGDRHYVLFCTNSTAAPRFDPGATGPHSGTYYVVSDQARGPYVPPPGDWLLIGQRDTNRLFSTYVGRPFQTGGETLLYHQWTAAYPTAYWGPPKRLVERGAYQLGLDYWPGCEKLKGELLSDRSLPGSVTPLKPAGRVPVIEWQVEDEVVQAQNQGGLHGIEWNVRMGAPSTSPTDLRDGRILEAEVRIREGRSLGIWFGREEAAWLAIFLNSASGAVEIGNLIWTMHGASLVFEPDERKDWPIARGAKHHLRVLARKNFVEVYLDDRFVHAYVSPKPIDPDQVGFCAELASGEIMKPRLWAMC